MKIEVSNGEIVDKLTILELKRQNAQTQEQARHIEEELDYLQPIVEGMDIPKELLTQLREVNKKLWEVEDMLREYEKTSNFGAKSVGHASASGECLESRRASLLFRQMRNVGKRS